MGGLAGEGDYEFCFFLNWDSFYNLLLVLFTSGRGGCYYYYYWYRKVGLCNFVDWGSRGK